MVGAVARRVDGRVRSAAALVHQDAVIAFKAGLLRQFDVGHDADAHHGEVGGEGLITALHRRDAAIATEAGYPRIRVNPRAAPLVQAMIEIGHGRGGHPRQDALLHFQHIDLKARLDAHRGHFEADVAAADHHHPLAGRHVGLYGVHIGDGAQVVDAFELAARQLEPPRAAARGEQQLFVGQGLARRCGQRLRRTIDALHAHTGAHGDVLAGIELLRAQVNPVQPLLAR